MLRLGRQEGWYINIFGYDTTKITNKEENAMSCGGSFGGCGGSSYLFEDTYGGCGASSEMRIPLSSGGCGSSSYLHISGGGCGGTTYTVESSGGCGGSYPASDEDIRRAFENIRRRW